MLFFYWKNNVRTCIFYFLPDSQLSAVDSLIDSMMLVEDVDDGKQKDIFKVHNIPNPAFQRLFQVVQSSRSRIKKTPIMLTKPHLSAQFQ